MKKNVLYLLTFLVVPHVVNAQYERSAVSSTGSGISTTKVTDYRAIGINPANVAVNRTEHSWHFSLMEIGASLYTDALTKTDLGNDFWNVDKKFTLQEKQQAAENFTNSIFTTDVDISLFGISYQTEKLGFAFSVNEKLHGLFRSNQLMADLYFLGKNSSYFDQQTVIEGIPTGVSSNPKLYSEIIGEDNARFSMRWTREFNLAAAGEFLSTDLLKLYGGIGVKYIAGYGSWDLFVLDEEFVMYSSITPLLPMNYDRPTPSQVSGTGLVKVGDGFGLDVGVTAELLKAITISASVIDIGTMTWNGNVYSVPENRLDKLAYEGLNSYNIFNEVDDIEDDIIDSQWEGLVDKQLPLPGMIRAGVQYDANGLFGGGIDFLSSLSAQNGSLTKPMFNIGGWIRPVKGLEISLGMVTGGNYKINLPFGINYNAGAWEFGIAVRDYKTYLTEETPNLSAVMSVLRFHIK